MELSRQNRNQQVVVDVEEEIVSEYSFKSTQEEFQRDEAEDGKEGDESLEGETKRKSKLSEEDGETYKDTKATVMFVFILIVVLFSVKTFSRPDDPLALKIIVLVYALALFYIAYQWTSSLKTGSPTRNLILKLQVGGWIATVACFVSVFYSLFHKKAPMEERLVRLLLRG